MTSTLGVTTIKRSNAKLVGLIFGSAVFVAIGLWMTSKAVIGGEPVVVGVFGVAGILLFGAAAIASGFRMAKGDEAPLRFSPTGLSDARNFTGELPWSDIARISEWRYRGTSMVRIDLVEGGGQTIQMTRSGAIARKLNASFGMGDLFIAASDVAVSFPKLWSVINAYCAEFRPEAIAPDVP